ncbi:MAG: uidR4 [Labilithrix sp.]|nr:uidR4 [Labilithrix sp.]
MRSDVQRNRALLLEAAASVFSERGVDASLEEVARRAKVGIGTLYRHFPTREALLVAACDDRLLALAQQSRDYAGTPVRALARFFERIVDHASMYRGLAESFGMVLQSGSPGCHATTEEGRRLLERAQREGEVKSDISIDDVLAMTAAISIAASQSADDEKRIGRLVQMLVDGLRPRLGPSASAKPGGGGKRVISRRTRGG